MKIRDRFDLVIFDWAGTMVDFGCHAPVIALREVFARRAVHISDAQARRDMGKAKADHVRALLQDPLVSKAWFDAQAANPTERDVEDLIAELGPKMREQAGRAAQLIGGAREAVETLRAHGVRVASSTGYTREMMTSVLAEAAAQGYAPEHMVCSGETPAGRPTPLMIYKACAELGVWPLSRVVKVDDTEAGVAEGRNAGCFTVGVSASGNGIGLTRDALAALPAGERTARLRTAELSLMGAGADVVIETVADLIPALEHAGHKPLSAPAPLEVA